MRPCRGTQIGQFTPWTRFMQVQSEPIGPSIQLISFDETHDSKVMIDGFSDHLSFLNYSLVVEAHFTTRADGTKVLGRISGAAVVLEDGTELYFDNGLLSRSRRSPAIKNQKSDVYVYCVDGIISRNDMYPAINIPSLQIWANGGQFVLRDFGKTPNFMRYYTSLAAFTHQGKSYTKYVREGIRTKAHLNEQGQNHLNHGPAVVIYYDDGFVGAVMYYHNGQLHNSNGAAVTYYTPRAERALSKTYYVHGQRHRVDGPAVIRDIGTEGHCLLEWHVNGQRTDLPAHPSQFVCSCGKLHDRSDIKKIDPLKDLIYL